VRRLFHKKEKPILAVMLGGEIIPVEPLGLEDTLRLAFLFAPYLAAFENHLPALQAALEVTGGARPALLSAAVRAMADDMRTSAPGDLTRIVAILVKRDPEWVAQNATPAEVVEALPVLDAVNDFAALLDAIRGLGLTLTLGKTDDAEN